MRRRRRLAARRPERQRRLARPVVSVGNLSTGGTGKTPIVAAIAAWLAARGHRPSILSRGYARANPLDGVVVVSDGAGIRAGLNEAGDEPLMLARALPGVAVCVSPDRHLAGVLAERSLGCTVHILDDGFQHLELARDLDVLVTSVGEIPGGRVLPMGRLREPIDAAASAHVLVVMGATEAAAAAEAWTLGIGEHCGARRVLGEPRAAEHPATPLAIRPASLGAGRAPGGDVLDRALEVIAVAGIGNPGRFFDDLRNAGWRVAHGLSFADHHRYTRADLARIEGVLEETGAKAVLTTDKDAIRFEPLDPVKFGLYCVPMTVEFDPQETLFGAVEAAVESGGRT